MIQNSVLKAWVYELPFRMQSVLMSSLRGCDTAKKDDASKFIQRALRGVMLNDADPSNTFIVGEVVEGEVCTQFLWDIDAYPMHYVMHTAHAAEIIGYKHPDVGMRQWWIDFYKKVCKGLHVNFETEEQLDVRLGDGEPLACRDENAWKPRPTVKCSRRSTPRCRSGLRRG